MGIRNRMTIQDLNEKFIHEPEWFDEILARVIDGEPLYDFLDECVLTRQGWLLWLEKEENAAFKVRWEDAKVKRKEMRREKIEQKLYARAMTDGIAVSEKGLLTAARMILGDKQSIEHGGKDGAPILFTKIEREVI